MKKLVFGAILLMALMVGAVAPALADFCPAQRIEIREGLKVALPGPLYWQDGLPGVWNEAPGFDYKGTALQSAGAASRECTRRVAAAKAAGAIFLPRKVIWAAFEKCGVGCTMWRGLDSLYSPPQAANDNCAPCGETPVAKPKKPRKPKPRLVVDNTKPKPVVRKPKPVHKPAPVVIHKQVIINIEDCGC